LERSENQKTMKNLILIGFLVISSLSFAQDEYGNYEFSSLENKKIGGNSNKIASFKLSFLFPSVGAEFKLAPKFSLETSGKLNSLIALNLTTSKVYFFPYPVIHAEPKWNYNILKREKRGKITDNFSSNFLSMFVSYGIKVSPYTFHSLRIGPTWGMQRNFSKIGYFKFNTGLVYSHIFSTTPVRSGLGLPIEPLLDVQLGIIF